MWLSVFVMHRWHMRNSKTSFKHHITIISTNSFTVHNYSKLRVDYIIQTNTRRGVGILEARNYIRIKIALHRQ